MLGKLTWYAKRLAVMNPAEVLHRINEQSLILLLNARYQLGLLPGRNAAYSRKDFRFSDAKDQVLPGLQWDIASVIKDKDAILSGRSDALGHQWTWSDARGLWCQAPDTGKQWPKRFFSSINYREGNEYGDVRLAWEPARLQQLVALALLARESVGREEQDAVMLISRQLESWLDENPMLCGIHYISSMECALRIIAVCHSLDVVRNRIADPDRIWSKVLHMVREHANLIYQRMSLHSSTGNHTVAESVGLIYAGVLFPEFDEADMWKRKGLGILGEEAERQILPDGGGLERAIWYHLFVTDLCELAVALLEHMGFEGIRKIKDACSRSRTFLNVLAARADDLPLIGDSDNGYALSKYLQLSWSGCREKSRLTVFETTGLSVIKGMEGDEVLYFNHGSLGMPPCYGHGHAHGLSALIRHNGEYLLVDPGTYTYTGDSAWRQYFRSTMAHNTVCVDEMDQARQLAAFMWTDAYTCELACKESENGVTALLAFHDGYKRDKGVIHWRGIIHQDGCGWRVWDYLSGEGKHSLRINWHTRDAIALENGRFGLSGNVEMSVDCRGASLVAATDATQLGWLSDIYGEKYTGKTITCIYTGSLPHEFITRISIGGRCVNDTTMAQYLRQFKRIINEAEKD